MANAADAGSKKAIKKELTGRQKAAVFLVTLGSEISSEIFKHLREDEIETLTFEIARLDNVEPEERDRVLMEFKELMMAQDFITSGGIDYARELLEKSLGSQKAVDIINRLTSSLQVRPFDFIRRTDPAHLLNFIQQEHP
ncbi:MAG: flagellar motor switch protein FliG, partial [Spirochaetales bacterium]|nr:flagellar motor switch protein FliG [Spirochaetales bacterium]